MPCSADTCTQNLRSAVFLIAEKMTRSARTRRGNRKAPLAGTPWGSLKTEGYKAITDESSSSPIASPSTAKVREVKKGLLKETKKQKLVDVMSKRLSKKFKQSLTSRKLKDGLKNSDTLSLLHSSDIGNYSAGGDNARKKKKKRKSSIAFGEDSVQHFNLEDQVSTLESSSGSQLCDRSDGDSNDHSAVDNTVSSSGNGYTVTAESNDASVGSRLRQPLIARSQDDERRQKKIEARRLRRHKQKVCFNCRKSGHLVQDCPQQAESDSCVAGVCFKCGSAEHTSRTCRVGCSEGDFPYAKCFICGEVGHLSRSCPDNPKGLYPNGGCCKLCGSVEHLKSNCPEKSGKNKSSAGLSGLVMVNPYSSADAEDNWTGADSSVGGKPKGQSSPGGRRGQNSTGGIAQKKWGNAARPTGRHAARPTGRHAASTAGNSKTQTKPTNGVKHKVVQF